MTALKCPITVWVRDVTILLYFNSNNAYNQLFGLSEWSSKLCEKMCEKTDSH